MKNTHGGKRKGAGAKPQAVTMDRISLTCPPKLRDRLRRRVKSSGRSLSAEIVALIEEGLKR